MRVRIGRLASFLSIMVGATCVVACQRNDPAAPFAQRATISGTLIQADDASLRPTTVAQLSFAGDDCRGWKLDGQADEVLIYDGNLFFRGPHPSAAARRTVDLATEEIDRIRIRVRGLGGARMVFAWTTTDGTEERAGHREFSVPGDDEWHDVDLDLANSNTWDGRAINVSVGVIERFGLLRVEGISFLTMSTEARMASIDTEAGTSISINNERRRARPLFGSRPLRVSIPVPPPRGARLSIALGVPRRTAVNGSRPITIDVSTGAGGRTITIPREMGWHELSIELDGVGTTDLVLDEAARASGDVVYVGAPLVMPSTRDRRPNVLLVTCDTLRRGFLSCYGNSITRTPTLDRLAREGIVFDDVTTCANSTNPSHTSIMTSLYPKDHGVLGNSDRLAEDAITLAELVGAQGYATAAAVASAVLNPLVVGIDQGFDIFFDSREAKRHAKDVNALAKPWIEAHRDQPFFLWVHYYDPHTPYAPPAKDLALYYDGDPRRESVDSADRLELPSERSYQFLEGVTDPEYPRALYRGEITSMDRELGDLLAELDRLGLREDTIVVFTADHGESLGEHGLFYTHEGLYFTTVRVPWLMRVPGGPGGLRISRACETIDIAPTILERLGIAAPPIMRGIAQSLDDHVPAGTRRNQYFQHAHGGSAGVRTDRLHGIVESTESVESERVQLFDVRSDPLMTVDVAPERTTQANELVRHVNAWLADRRELASAPAELTSEQRQILEQLGYTGK